MRTPQIPDRQRGALGNGFQLDEFQREHPKLTVRLLLGDPPGSRVSAHR
ncbi:hypothetical protein ACYZT9_04035 [Pseudomonas sp. ZT5P21]